MPSYLRRLANSLTADVRARRQRDAAYKALEHNALMETVGNAHNALLVSQMTSQEYFNDPNPDTEAAMFRAAYVASNRARYARMRKEGTV